MTYDPNMWNTICPNTMDTLWQIPNCGHLSTDPGQLFNNFFMCFKSWHLLICRALWLFYIKAFRDFSSFLLDLSRLFLVFSPPKHSILFQTFNPRDFRPFLISDHLVWSLYLSFFLHFMHLDLGFGFFEKILGFFKINEVFVKFLGWVLCKWF